MIDPQTITIPGAVDLHVHLREPSTNDSETISSGTKAALMGGFVAVCDMPNNPGNPTWNLQALKDKHTIVEKNAFIPVGLYAGSQPETDNLSELEKMASSVIGLKLYGSVTTGNNIDYDPNDFLYIAKKWKTIAPDKPIMLHSGKDNLEEFIKLIAVKNRLKLHVCHVNSPDDVRIINKYKQQNLPITCGVCPHHLFMTSHNAQTQGWFARMMPPLARQSDSEELLAMLAGGQIDVVETDHAPHSAASKWVAEENNPEGLHDPSHATCFGVPGIEFALPLLFYQMKRGKIGLERIIEVTSKKPAEIIGVGLSPKTKVTWRMEHYRINDEKSQVVSGAKWTPFLGMIAYGKVQEAIIGGKKILFKDKITSKYSKVLNNGDEI